MPTSKLQTPPQRTFPSSTSRSIVSHESSTAVPVSSGQWNWYRSIRSTPRRVSEASHSRRIEAGCSTRRGSAVRSFSSQTSPHLVKMKGRSAAGSAATALPTITSECPSPYTAAVSSQLMPSATAR